MVHSGWTPKTTPLDEGPFFTRLSSRVKRPTWVGSRSIFRFPARTRIEVMGDSSYKSPVLERLVRIRIAVGILGPGVDGIVHPAVPVAALDLGVALHPRGSLEHVSQRAIDRDVDGERRRIVGHGVDELLGHSLSIA